MSKNKSYGFSDWISHPDLHISISKYPQESTEDATLRRFKDKNLFIASLIALALVFIICIVFLIFNKNSVYEGIALNGVIGLALALVGYYARGAR